MSHAAQLDADSIVVRVIVADPAWAAERFGGTWVAADKTEQTGRYPGIGWRWDAALGDFVPPDDPSDPDAQPEPAWPDPGPI